MGARHVDRIWIVAGAAVIVALAAASWFLLIGPQYSDASDIRDEAETARTQQITLQRKLTELKQQDARLTEYRAALKKNQRALPTDSGIPDFLRQLQISGEATGVTVSNIAVATPVLVSGSTTTYEVAIIMNAGGTADELNAFLIRLQNVQARAVLIESANLVIKDSAEAELNLTLNAFIKPPAGSGTPTVTPSASSTSSATTQ